MTTPPLLTLICPMYRVSAYVDALVDSLVAALPSPQVAVVFVDDASPDDSMERCVRRLSELGSRVRFRPVFVERLRNGGIAAARNTGLECADGRYVGFVDSDDVLDPHYFRVLEPLLRREEHDIVGFGYREFRGEPPAAAGAQGSAGPGSQLDPYDAGFFAWARVYRRELVQDLSFPEGRIFEDLRFVTEAYARAQRIARLSHVLLHYRRRPGSITTRQRDHRYAHQLINLVEGAARALPGFHEPGRAAALTARKAFVILLKGARIRAARERRRFFGACRAPLQELAALCRGAGTPGWGRAWLGSGRMLAWLGQRL